MKNIKQYEVLNIAKAFIEHSDYKIVQVEQGIHITKDGVLKVIETAIKQIEHRRKNPVAFTNTDELQELKNGMTTCYMYKKDLIQIVFHFIGRTKQ